MDGLEKSSDWHYYYEFLIPFDTSYFDTFNLESYNCLHLAATRVDNSNLYIPEMNNTPLSSPSHAPPI